MLAAHGINAKVRSALIRLPFPSRPHLRPPPVAAAAAARTHFSAKGLKPNSPSSSGSPMATAAFSTPSLGLGAAGGLPSSCCARTTSIPRLLLLEVRRRGWGAPRRAGSAAARLPTAAEADEAVRICTAIT